MTKFVLIIQGSIMDLKVYVIDMDLKVNQPLMVKQRHIDVLVILVVVLNIVFGLELNYLVIWDISGAFLKD